jgi:hypothetical protein
LTVVILAALVERVALAARRVFDIVGLKENCKWVRPTRSRRRIRAPLSVDVLWWDLRCGPRRRCEIL